MIRRSARGPALGWAMASASVVALVGCGSSPPDRVSPPAPVVPIGFEAERVRLSEPGGASCERCLLVAEAVEDRRRGLMGVTDLGGYDGMIFVYETPTRSAYWMKDTLLPLSISFYDEEGDSLAQFTMEPCVADPCPAFGPDQPFSMAVEVAGGRLPELGFTPTARLERLGVPCEPTSPSA